MTVKSKLKPEQAKALKDLEKLIGENIPLVEKIGDYKFGVKIEGDKVVGLGLDQQGLSTLPESISNLKSLKELGLWRNQFKTLPESITKLESLQTLDLRLNKFSTLPDSVLNLKSLKTLYLSWNKFSTFPESISKLTSLTYLSLGYNEFSTLPESISNLKSLTYLRLKGNKFTALPESVSNLKSLQTLDLSYNEFSTLPESIGNLKSLQTLDLDGNQLLTLPESISNLKNLNKIVLSGNKWKGEWAEMEKLEDIPKIFELCRKLHGINIFVSHAMIDQMDYPIIELKENLEKGAIIHNVLICEEDLRDSIQAFMDKNVPRSQLLLFIATKNSLTSKDCLYELSLSKKYGVKILLIKGNDIDREDLKRVDLRKLGQDFMDLSNLECFKFTTEVFDKLYRYITKHESELRILKKEQEKLDNGKSNMLKNIIDFVDSNEFTEHLKEYFEEFQTVSQEVNSNRITDFEYLSKLSEILKKKDE